MIVQLTSLFGLVALVLAAIGLYGVTAHAVAAAHQRDWHPHGTWRDRVHVQKMVLADVFHQVGIGLLTGIPAAVAAGHLMAAELYGVNEWNLLVLGTTTAVLGVVGLLAAALPARRAAAVEPMEALRGE
jgi:putative ABC transport system permease protein